MNQYFYILIVTILFSLPILFWYFYYKPNKKTKVKDLYSEGLDLLIAGHRKSAYQNFKNIIQNDTENIKAYLKMGQVIREGGNPAQALKLHKSLALRQKLTFYEEIELRKNLALDYYENNNLEQAVSELEKLLKVDKTNEWAIIHLVKFYKSKLNWSKAGEYLELYQKQSGNKDEHKRALYKIQEGRVHINNKDFKKGRKKFEEALNIDPHLALAYYFIGNSYSAESEQNYQLIKSNDKNEDSLENKNYLDNAKKFLSQAIPMWIRYLELKPKQAWMVIHLLKDALFALDRYPEIEEVLEQILSEDPDNIEVIASLSDIHAHKGEIDKAIDLLDAALDNDSSSIIVKLIRMKLVARKEKAAVGFIRALDDVIHSLVTDERFQVYKNTATDKDVHWLYEHSKEIEKLEL